MRNLARLLAGASLLLATIVLTSSGPAFAATTPPAIVINLCAQFDLDPCPSGAANVDPGPVTRQLLPKGCYRDYADVQPNLFYYYDPAAGFEYPILYAGVAVQVYCPQPANLTTVAESIPDAPTRTNSKVQEVHTCTTSTYCESTAIWAHNWLFNQPVCAYTSATGSAGVSAAAPHFPWWSTAGAWCT